MMRSWPIPAFLILALALASVLAGCGAKDDNQAGRAGQPGAEVGTAVGQLAPSFALTTLDGSRLDLASLQGKAVLLDFWDTWCGPCRRALPHLQELSEEHGGDLVVVGVALGQEGEAKVRSFVRQNNLSFTFALGGEAIFQQYGVTNLPTTFLLDRDGTVRQRWIGGYGKAEYDRAVRSVLGG